MFWARDNQLAPATAQNGVDPWRVWLLLAGRGFGKTRTGVEWLRAQAEAGVTPLHLVGRTAADVRDVLVEGPAGILACSPPWFRPEYKPALRRLVWPNGVTATTFSAEEPDQLRGPQCAAALADELAAWQYVADAWSNLLMGLRLGHQPQVAVMTTPRPLPIIRQLVGDPKNAVTRGSTRDNRENLAASAIEDLERRYAGTRLGRQELDGEILDDVPGALWTRAMLEAALERGRPYSMLRERVRDLFERIAIGVDPSGSPGAERGDAIGIVVVGKLKGVDEAVVLQDATCQERPEVWAGKVAQLYHDWQADIVAAESNYGGDMVRAVLQGASGGRNLPVKLVTASRGKHVRAEPVSRLYEQGRVHHARGFVAMEDEMCFFTPNGFEGDASPNRADALVWALTELMLSPRSEPRIRRL